MWNRLNAVFCGILVAAVAAGCPADRVAELRTPDRMTLYSLDGKEGSIKSYKMIAATPQPLLNKYLKDAGVPLDHSGESIEPDDPLKK